MSGPRRRRAEDGQANRCPGGLRARGVRPFHIGHLNLLRAAKEHCDHLIAGVVSDEMAHCSKGSTPVVPTAERLAIVEAIRYVDEAVVEDVPYKLDMWKRLHSDVLVKGDDWKGTDRGEKLESDFWRRCRGRLRELHRPDLQHDPAQGPGADPRSPIPTPTDSTRLLESDRVHVTPVDSRRRVESPYPAAMAWIYLAVAIVSEVPGTSFLKESDGFSRLWPSIISLAGYAVALFTLSLAVRSIELGIAYAIWAGVGTALIVLIGWLVLGQRIDAAAIVGVLMIVGGVVVINAFSEIVA
ncbi:MAG: SMR family transporter [Microthrixaceae bacterium]